MQEYHTEPQQVREYFRKLQAAYRAQAIHTPGEWPMYTEEGRESYRRSVSQERLYADLNLKDAIDRAAARATSVPYGSVINFEKIMYGMEQ